MPGRAEQTIVSDVVRPHDIACSLLIFVRCAPARSGGMKDGGHAVRRPSPLAIVTMFTAAASRSPSSRLARNPSSSTSARVRAEGEADQHRITYNLAVASS